MTTDHQLTVRGLCKCFGNEFEVSDVDFEVGSNEIVALLGPSGCGKTTVLRCIAGVETPDAGEISIGGEVVFGNGKPKPPEKRNIGMVYQNYAIWPHKSVYENVVFPLHHATHDVPRDKYDERVDEVLDLVEIRNLKDSPATDLSGGQQQRTALARSLVHDPDLLLMDEPLSNLDRELRKNMRYQLQRLHHELDLSMLYVTHDQEEAFYLADRVIVMNDGKIVERGEPRPLYERPKSPFTRQFVGEYNRFPGVIETGAGGAKVVRNPIVDFPLANVDLVSDGTPTGDVVCFIRPIDVSVGQFGLGGDGVLEVTGTVIAEGVLGARYEVTVGIGDARLVVHTDTDRPYAPGDEISLYFQPAAIQVYGASP